LPVGAKIKIPPVEEAKASPLAEGETYIVQKGDTLTKISLIHYGKPDYANLIFEANRATIQEPGKLRVGMVLNIPPVPVKGH
jgi:nucleoid-associated protein YgaU